MKQTSRIEVHQILVRQALKDCFAYREPVYKHFKWMISP